MNGPCEESRKPQSCEELIEKYIGPRGRWQRVQLACAYLQSVTYAGCYLIYLISAYTPPHRCWVPECETLVSLRLPTLRAYKGLARVGPECTVGT